MENTLLESALQYARRGWYVFPCREKNGEPFFDKKLGKERFLKAKSPYILGGFQVATTDEHQIKEWWTKWPNAAIGVSCGHSNLVAIDIDIKDGRKGFDNFMRLNVSDSGALHSLTPSGGNHIIYSGQEHSQANVLKGVDLRSIGGYILVPPSKIEVDSKVLSYIELDDWDRTPSKVPTDLIEKLNLLRGKTEKRNKEKYVSHETQTQLVKRAKEALDKLPQIYCDEYWSWISVAMSLKSLGDDGFKLWDEWSQKSSKYEKSACEYRWNRFDPREITIASLFFWAKEEEKRNG